MNKVVINTKISNNILLEKRFEIRKMLDLNNAICLKIAVLNKDGYYLGSNLLFLKSQYMHSVLSNWDKVNKNKFDNFLKILIADNLEDIIKSALESLPNREEIIKCIFKLYNEQNYIALIPLVLAQIDGIAKKMTLGKTGFYNIKTDKIDKTEKLLFPASNIYVHFISNAMQLHYTDRNDFELFKKDIKNNTVFNRHAILHGESTQFGTERNAIKAILLFDFICEIYNANN